MGIFAPYEIPDINVGPGGRRYPHGALPNGFAPQYLCLATIKFEPVGVAVRHAYFPMPPNLEAFATAEFSSLAATGQWATAPIRSEVNFEKFTFGSQQLILFHIDSTGAPANFDPNNLVQFAEWGARAPPTPSNRRARNNCFLNAEVRNWSEMEILILENWFVDDAGRPIGPGVELHYAMNLHVLAECALPGSPDGMWDLPMVLDPDTGNMGGGSL
jgi:hypothetical protein